MSSTSHSEMPSTPSLKWMPSDGTHSLVDDVVPAASASKPPRGTASDEGRQRGREGDAAQEALFLARQQQAAGARRRAAGT